MILSFILAGAAASMPVAEIVEPDPKAMSQKQIRAFNAKLDRGHPLYIKCVKSEPIGSLVKRNFSCRTNAQWQKAEEIGNQDVRDTMEEMQSKSWNTSN